MESLSHMTLQQRLHEVILHSPHLTNCKIHCRASKNGELVIQGEAHSFFAKQMAQEALRNVDGVVSIENELTVIW